jgi:hypothetical protein
LTWHGHYHRKSLRLTAIHSLGKRGLVAVPEMLDECPGGRVRAFAAVAVAGTLLFEVKYGAERDVDLHELTRV